MLPTMTEWTAPDTVGPNAASPDMPGMSGPPRPAAVSARAAADVLGVNERTIRRWIDQGHLAAVKIRGSYRIAPDEIERARLVILGEGSAQVVDVEHRTEPDRPDDSDTIGTPGRARPAAAAADITPAARAQLAAIRDEFVAPLVEQIREQAEEIGRLKAERDALWSRLEQIEAEQDAPVAAKEGAGRAETTATAPDAPRSWWTRLRRWYAGG
jgi:excisionase family DNA binding protein